MQAVTGFLQVEAGQCWPMDTVLDTNAGFSWPQLASAGHQQGLRWCFSTGNENDYRFLIGEGWLDSARGLHQMQTLLIRSTGGNRQ